MFTPCLLSDDSVNCTSQSLSILLLLRIPITLLEYSIVYEMLSSEHAIFTHDDHQEQHDREGTHSVFMC